MTIKLKVQKYLQKAKDSLQTSTLYVLATPIGNLADISLRALAALEGADLICAEDTRVSGKLMSAYGIQNKLISVREHNEQAMSSRIIEELQSGKIVVQISDAGTPAICDPGARLVKAVREAGFSVSPIPGASAVIAALSVAGLEGEDFYFAGFLPSKPADRRKKLNEFVAIPSAIVVYETPHRIEACLQDMHNIMPERPITLAREITKTFETIVTGSISTILHLLAQDKNQLRGEMVLIFHGQKIIKNTELDEETLRILGVLVKELPTKQSVDIATKITGANKKILYNLALAMKEQD